MTSPIENQLAEVLAAKASTIPAGAGERFASIDYRPRTPRVSARRLGAGGAAGVAAAVVGAVLLTSSTPAFAGWTPKGSKATPAQLADANLACASQLAALPGSDWQPVVTDVTGPYTLVVYEDANQDHATCLTGSGVTQVMEISGSGITSEGSVSSSGSGQVMNATQNLNLNDSAGLEQYTSSHYTMSGQGTYTLADGQVDSDVTAVTVNLSNGQAVGATLGGGWLVAWWPGSATAVSAAVTTPSGTTTVPLNSASSSPIKQ